LALAALVVAVLACIQNAHAASDVVELDAWNFDKTVLQSELPFLVEFFAPWCGHCKALAPEWEKAAANLKDLLPVGKVDCTAHGNLCSKYGVHGYTTIKMFSEKGKTVADYNQAREAPSIVRYALGAIKATIFDVKNDKNLQAFYDHRPDAPHVILFSSKDKPTPLYKVQSVNHQDKIVFGMVPESAKEIVSSFGVTSFPQLRQVSPTLNIELEGGSSAEGLKEAINELAGRVTIIKDDKPKDAKKASGKAAKGADEGWIAATADTLDKVCENSVCILAFAGEGEADKAILTAVHDSYKRDGKFKFAQPSKDLRTKFAIESGSHFVAYNVRKGRYAKTDELTEKAAKSLIDRVVGGDVKWTSL